MKPKTALEWIAFYLFVLVATFAATFIVAKVFSQEPRGAGPVQIATVGVDPTTGREVACDLPASQHLRNIRGKNGEGCCVWASTEMMARYFRFRQMYGVLNEKMGGAHDGHVTAAFARKAPGFTQWIQATGAPSAAVLDWAMASNRLCCVTYTQSHMVILLHLDPATMDNPRACIVDNNDPTRWHWMSRAEFLKRHSVGGAWSFTLLLPPPPPVPYFNGGN